MVSLIYNIQDNKIEEFTIGFLKCTPIPIKNGQPTMTPKQWIKEWGKQKFMIAYRIGKQQIAREQTIIENEIIE